MIETLNSINETLNRLASCFVCFNVDRVREVNVVESILDKNCETNDKFEETNERLETIEKDLSQIANALERIANIFETKETRSFTLKIENCLDPLDGPFCSQEQQESEGFADMA